MRVGAVVNRLESVASVWGSAHLLSEHNGIGPAEPSGNKLAARIFFADSPDLLGVGIGNSYRPLITDGISATIPGTVGQHLTHRRGSRL